jgi:hypothetical protein
MKPTAEILARASREVEAGRAWRAKEILRGRIGSGPMDPDILDAYGLLLDRLGDRFEAGKYLFLSGKRSPDRAPAIELFLQRQANHSRSEIQARFPAAVRTAPFESLPVMVQQELTALGVRWKTAGRASGPHRAPMTIGDRLRMIGALIVLAIFVVSLGLGIARLWTLFWSWLP